MTTTSEEIALCRRLLQITRQTQADGKWTADDELTDDVASGEMAAIRHRLETLHESHGPELDR
jgi:hypothetical protein